MKKVENCTLLVRFPKVANSAALSRSASSKIMMGFFPPNSRDTGFRLLVAAACITKRPTSVDPVKVTWNFYIRLKCV